MKLIDQNFRPLPIEEIYKIDSILADEVYTEKMRGIRNLVDMVFDIVPDKKFKRNLKIEVLTHSKILYLGCLIFIQNVI